jgi:serine/threonine protein kinase
MAELTPSSEEEGWQVVAPPSHHPQSMTHAHSQLQSWTRNPLHHWSGAGKHVRENEIKYNFHVEPNLLGHGGSSYVQKVRYRNVWLARKMIRCSRGVGIQDLRKEVTIMEKLVHKHVVELVGSYHSSRRELVLLTFPVAVCDLRVFLNDVEDLSKGDTSGRERFEALQLGSDSLEKSLRFLRAVLGCVTNAVEFVHRNGVRHRDLKPSNILLSPKRVYLADFGISRNLKEGENSLTESYAGGTERFQAPEVADMLEHHDKPADVYSLGSVFLAVATSLYGVEQTKCDAVMVIRDQSNKSHGLAQFLKELKVFAGKSGLVDENVKTCAPKHILGLLSSMLQREPEKRPTVEHVSRKLVEYGGPEQIYHQSCCRKDTKSLIKVIGRSSKKSLIS